MQRFLCWSRQDVPVVDEQFRQLERELGLLLRRAQASSAAISRDVHPDLEPAAYSLLALIAASPGVRASDLAMTIGVGRGHHVPPARPARRPRAGVPAARPRRLPRPAPRAHRRGPAPLRDRAAGPARVPAPGADRVGRDRHRGAGRPSSAGSTRTSRRPAGRTERARRAARSEDRAARPSCCGQSRVATRSSSVSVVQLGVDGRRRRGRREHRGPPARGAARCPSGCPAAPP